LVGYGQRSGILQQSVAKFTELADVLPQIQLVDTAVKCIAAGARLLMLSHLSSGIFGLNMLTAQPTLKQLTPTPEPRGCVSC